MSIQTLDQYLHRAIVWITHFLVLALPLIWVEANSELFEFPKMIFVYALSALLVCLSLIRWSLLKKVEFNFRLVDWAVLGFLVSQLISTVFSMHSYTSFFGYYTRLNGGLLSILAYSGIYWVVSRHFSHQQLRRLVVMLVVSLGVSSLIAFPEHFGYALSCFMINGQSLVADCWQQDIVTRVFGTFGQPNWLAAYIVSLLPLTWVYAIQARPRSNWVWLTAFAIIAVATSVLIFTKSRSGLLGNWLSLAIFFPLAGWVLKQTQVKFAYKLPVALLGLIAALVFIWGTPFNPSLNQLLNQSNQPETTPTPDPTLTALDQGGTESGDIRKIVWRGALDIATDHWLIGTGVETFAYSYYQYRPIEHNLVSEWNFLYNKAHNEFLNHLANSGVIGLGTYLGLLSAIAWMCLRLIKQSDQPQQHRLLAIGILSGLAAMSVSNFFGFSTVTVNLILYLMAAIVAGLGSTNLEDQSNNLANQVSWRIRLSLAVSLFVLGSVWLWLAGYYRADLVYAQALKDESSSNYADAMTGFYQAISQSPHQARFYNDYADLLAKVASALASQEDQRQTAEQVANQAVVASAETLSRNPVHLNYYSTQAGVMIRLSVLDAAYLETADRILSQAFELAPTDPKYPYNLGLLQLDMSQADTAQAYFEQAVEMKPNYESARQELAQLYLDQQDYQAALDQYRYIVNYIAPENTLAQTAIANLEATLSGQLD